MNATQHSHGPNFGRHVDGCPRCAELANGAPARKPSWVARKQEASREEARKLAAIKAWKPGQFDTRYDW